MKKENSDKIILDLCGGTGAWSKPYKDAGYEMKEIRSIGDNIFRDRNTRQELRGITPTSFAKAFFKANQ